MLTILNFIVDFLVAAYFASQVEASHGVIWALVTLVGCFAVLQVFYYMFMDPANGSSGLWG